MKKTYIENSFIIINSDININNPYNNFILLINYNDISNDLKKSYNNNNNKIFEQFKRDYPRCKIYINNQQEYDYNIFIKYFEFSFIENNYNIYDLYLFCTQAIMGYCLEILHKNLSDDLYIGELKKPKSLIYNIQCKNNKITINVKKKLRIFSVSYNGTPRTLYKILIELYIPLYNNENIIMLYKILKNKST